MANFDAAIDYVLRNEGGYVNDPEDPGGETNYGICKRDHPTVDIKNLTLVEVKQIYLAAYWRYDGIASQMIATKLLDWAVNMEGNGWAGAAIFVLQKAVKVQFPAFIPDGVYGPQTERFTNLCQPEHLILDMRTCARIHRTKLILKNPKLQKFFNGWMERDNRMPAAAAGA